MTLHLYHDISQEAIDEMHEKLLGSIATGMYVCVCVCVIMILIGDGIATAALSSLHHHLQASMNGRGH
jgi:hypothetical protein